MLTQIGGNPIEDGTHNMILIHNKIHTNIFKNNDGTNRLQIPLSCRIKPIIVWQKYILQVYLEYDEIPYSYMAMNPIQDPPANPRNELSLDVG